MKRRVIITGGSKGIGKAIAERFAKEECDIYLLASNGENLENTQTFNRIIPSVHIGKLPIMLKSSLCVLSQYRHISSDVTGECKYNTGGYFIINGSEKTCIAQERAAENQIYCFNNVPGYTK